MKTLILIFGIFFLISCKEASEIEQETTQSGVVSQSEYLQFQYGTPDEYRIQDIDGCEYIIINGRENEQPSLAHKGNCKYCDERAKNKELGLETVEE